MTPPNAPPAFDAVLAGVRAKDHEATATIWRNHHPVLVRWLGSLTPEAEDVASEAWVEALRSIDRFTGTEADFRTWLFTIARRRLIDKQRRAGRMAFSSLEGTQVVAGDDPEQTAVSRSQADEAAALIVRSLPPEQAEALLLRVISGLDVDQIAEVTGKSAGAIRVLHHRGLRKLANVLEKDSQARDSQAKEPQAGDSDAGAEKSSEIFGEV